MSYLPGILHMYMEIWLEGTRGCTGLVWKEPIVTSSENSTSCCQTISLKMMMMVKPCFQKWLTANLLQPHWSALDTQELLQSTSVLYACPYITYHFVLYWHTVSHLGQNEVRPTHAGDTMAHISDGRQTVLKKPQQHVNMQMFSTVYSCNLVKTKQQM